MLCQIRGAPDWCQSRIWKEGSPSLFGVNQPAGSGVALHEQAQVGHLGEGSPMVVEDQDVVRLEVAVGDAQCVEVVQGTGGVDCKPELEAKLYWLRLAPARAKPHWSEQKILTDAALPGCASVRMNKDRMQEAFPHCRRLLEHARAGLVRDGSPLVPHPVGQAAVRRQLQQDARPQAARLLD